MKFTELVVLTKSGIFHLLRTEIISFTVTYKLFLNPTIN